MISSDLMVKRFDVKNYVLCISSKLVCLDLSIHNTSSPRIPATMYSKGKEVPIIYIFK